MHNGLHRTGWISTKKIAVTCSSHWSYIVVVGAKIFHGYYKRLKSYAASKVGKLTILLQWKPEFEKLTLMQGDALETWCEAPTCCLHIAIWRRLGRTWLENFDLIDLCGLCMTFWTFFPTLKMCYSIRVLGGSTTESQLSSCYWHLQFAILGSKIRSFTSKGSSLWHSTSGRIL